MLDIKFIRENPDLIREAARKKHLNFNVDELLAVEAKRVALLGEVEARRARQNEVSKQVVDPAHAGNKEQLIGEMKALKAELKGKEDELALVMKEWQRLMLQVPNVPDISVPEGETDAKNLEVRTGGAKPTFNFAPQSHVELMTVLGWLDVERGTKLAGFRGYIMQGEAVVANLALWHYALDFYRARGFTPMLVPALVGRQAFLGTGYLPQGEEDLYHTQDGTYLAGTAEVGVMASMADEVLEHAALPKKILAFSPCFRREAGAHGKDTKGLIRVHEFYKWELVIVGEASHEASVAYHEELTAAGEAFVDSLGLAYRVVANCGGDLGLGQVKKYDIEVWLPSEGKYREVSSASYFHDFQTRRLGLRYRDGEGKLRFAHSLNNTALATPRFLAALVEHYQTADGQVAWPAALQAYVRPGDQTLRA